MCCGATVELDFDHIDPTTKSFAISVAIRDGRGRVKIADELKKCQLLCRSCHIGKTITNLDGGRVEHGGGVSGKLGCVCKPCKTQKAKYMAARKDKYNENRRLKRMSS